MVKVFEQHLHYEHPWSGVSLALLLKYPNPISRHVVAGDIVERWVDPQGRLVTRRVFKKTGSSLPAWMAHVRIFQTSPEHAHALVIEDTVVDPVACVSQCTSRNVSYRGWLVVEEVCTYYRALHAHDGNNSTRCDCRITVQSGPRLAAWGRVLMGKVEAFGVSKLREQLAKSRQALNYILEHNALVQRLCQRAKQLL
jgi:4-amino-4-deoxychorismate lyase